MSTLASLYEDNFALLQAGSSVLEGIDSRCFAQVPDTLVTVPVPRCEGERRCAP